MMHSKALRSIESASSIASEEQSSIPAGAEQNININDIQTKDFQQITLIMLTRITDLLAIIAMNTDQTNTTKILKMHEEGKTLAPDIRY